MHDISEFKIKLVDTKVGRMEVVKAVRRATRTDQYTMSDCNLIAHLLLKGDRWCPTPMMLASDPRDGALSAICTIEVDKVIDEYQQLRAEHNELMARIERLISAGADGDPFAAIEVCKGLKDGRFVGYFAAMG